MSAIKSFSAGRLLLESAGSELEQRTLCEQKWGSKQVCLGWIVLMQLASDDSQHFTQHATHSNINNINKRTNGPWKERRKKFLDGFVGDTKD